MLGIVARRGRAGVQQKIQHEAYKADAERCLSDDMKRAFKSIAIGLLLLGGGVAAWCVAYPLLFSERYQADQAEYQDSLSSIPGRLDPGRPSPPQPLIYAGFMRPLAV